MAFKWGYRNKDGPDTWGKFVPAARAPKLGQSPIDINPGDAEKAALPKLRISYKRGKCRSFSNNGHTFVVDMEAPDDYSVRRGPLKDDRYALCQFHFHWGTDDGEGSEHTINGRRFAAEAHFVHYNTQYGSFKEAMDKKDGLCVLAVMFMVGNENRAIGKMIESFENIRHKGMKHNVEPDWFHPKWLIPRRENRQKYWYYYGSLTTPPCFESVNWIVFKVPQQISPEQLAEFRNLSSFCPHCGTADADDEHEGRMVRNWRPTCPKDFDMFDEEAGESRPVTRQLWTVNRKRVDGVWEALEEELAESSSSDSSGFDLDFMDSDRDDWPWC